MANGNGGRGDNAARGEMCTMVRKRVHFELEQATEGGFWIWEYKIGLQTKSGQIKTTFRKLAIRKVRQKIDRDLRELHVQRIRQSSLSWE